MIADPALTPLDWPPTPPELIAAWPADRPLAALLSARAGSPWSRWSVFAEPEAGRTVRVESGQGNEAIGALRELFGRRVPGTRTRPPAPFTGGWIGWLSYDLGRHLEPKAVARPGEPASSDDRAWPLLVMHRCAGAYLHDGRDDRWHRVGPAGSLPRPETGPTERSARVQPFKPGRAERAYMEAVERTIELIRAGDIYQANIAHRLSAGFEGSARALSERLLGSVQPWYGAHIESADGAGNLREAVVSVSPELFLRFDAGTRRVVTRPIKGTRSGIAGAASLERSDKDAAELAMIVDLMRNDLGRVCETGSVRVEDPRAIEPHASGTILHGVATISGTLREDATLFDLLCAAFPPGSITGAPKVRAMQVIDALEPVRRGPYCGAVGFVSDSGDACFSVAIRTAALRFVKGSTPVSGSGTIDYGVGAGVVADSLPSAEWRETLNKAGALLTALAPVPETARA